MGAIVVPIAVCLPMAGYRIASLRSLALKRVLVWGVTIAAIALTDRLLHGQPAWLRMFALIGVLLIAMKSVVYAEWTSRDSRGLPPLRWLAFHLWIGMRPVVFANRSDVPYDDAGRYYRHGLTRFAIGFGLTALSWLAWHSAVHEEWNLRLVRIAATGLLLAGLSLMGHFGVFNLWAGAWRKAGFDCRPVFRNPAMSRSLDEFWSRRWNLAFSEMTSWSVFRPLTGTIGRDGAAFASFLFSGVLHELAISLPVRQGYGMPLLYFAIHGAGIVLERRLEKRGFAIAAKPWLGRVWTLAWLLLPIPLLFHQAFLRGIVWPIVGI